MSRFDWNAWTGYIEYNTSGQRGRMNSDGLGGNHDDWWETSLEMAGGAADLRRLGRLGGRQREWWEPPLAVAGEAAGLRCLERR